MPATLEYQAVQRFADSPTDVFAQSPNSGQAAA